jgi:hypothetical protein
MTIRRYSIKESLNRWYRLLRGDTITNDEPGSLPGPQYSENESLSRMVQLWNGEIPGETLVLPTTAIQDASETQKGIAELATTAEAQTGTDAERITTPEGVLASILFNAVQTVEIGEIYNTSTGTPVVQLSTSWTKITGSFQGNGASSDHITPDFANDRITVSINGTYFVGLFPSFSGTNNSIIEGAAYVDGVRQETARFRRKLGVGGDVGSAAALGTFTVTGSPVNIEFYARSDAGTPDFKLETGQLFVFGIVQEN